MNVHMVIAHIEKGDTLAVEIHRPGEIVMKIGGGVMVWIYERTNPEVYGDICKRFDLQKEAVVWVDTEKVTDEELDERSKYITGGPQNPVRTIQEANALTERLHREAEAQKETAPSGDTGDGPEREGLQLESKEGVT